MRIMDAAFLAAMSDGLIRPIYILTIEPGTTDAPYYRWTNAPYDVPHGLDENDDPAVYVQQSFEPGDIVIDDNGNAAVDLTFSGVNKVVRGILYNEDWSHRPAVLVELWVDADGEVFTEFIEAEGRIEPGIANFEDPAEPVSLAIVPFDAEGAPGPAQKWESTCRYKNFQGRQCGYAGPETVCDRTFAQCTTYGNQARYGGSRFAPKPGHEIRVGSSSLTVGSRT